MNIMNDTTTIPLIGNYQPQKPFIATNDQLISQQQFLNHATAIAEHLADADHIINLCHNRYYFALGFAAAIIKGKSTLLPPNRQQTTITNLINKYINCLIISDSDENKSLPTLNIYTLTQPNANQSKVNTVPEIASHFIAAIAFTSGSTGKPTANAKCWRTLCGTAHRLKKRFNSNTTTSLYIIATVPSQHMYGLEMSIMMALQGESVLVDAQPFYPADVELELNRTFAPCLLVTTPIHLRAIVKEKIYSKPPLKIISSTAPLSINLAMEAEHLLKTQVNEIYGCTETGSLATRHTSNSETWTMLDDMQLTVEKNSIYVKGPHLIHKTLLQDRLEIYSSEQFKFLGRATDLLNTGGKRASLSEITHLLMEIEGVEDAIVFLNDADTTKNFRPAAFVVTEKSERSILNALSKKVDPVFLPRPLKKLDHIPRNQTGKVSYSTLQKLLKS